MTYQEQNIIFGSTLNTVSDILNMNEAVTAGNMNKATENYVSAAKTGNAIVTNKAKSTLDYVQAQAVIDNNEKRRKAEEKDHLSGEQIKEDTGPEDFAKKNLEMKQQNKQKFQDKLKQDRMQDEKKLQALDAQIDAARRRVDATKAASNAANSTEENMQESMNQIEKNEENAKLATKEVEKTNGEDGIKTADENEENDEKLTENMENPVKVSARRFSKMLFNGSSGDALKYFIYGQITDGNREEIYIARKMQGDHEVSSVIKKIEFLLRKASSGKFTDEDYLELKVQKSKFRQLFYKFKKENK